MAKARGDYNHKKGSLIEACGFTTDDTDEMLDTMKECFSVSGNPSRIVEKLEQSFDTRQLALTLVNTILSTQSVLHERMTPDEIRKMTVTVEADTRSEDDLDEKEEIG